MPQDVTYDLEICSEIDLPRRMTVPEQVTADRNGRDDTSKSDVLANPTLQPATCERSVWYSISQKYLASGRSPWSASLQVRGESTCYRRQ
jgi:hypothetical protein